jgi:hypothetical protein
MRPQTPQRLYHYTSIPSLAMILKARKIRFSRLDLLDDLTEGITEDFLEYRKFCYVSSWDRRRAREFTVLGYVHGQDDGRSDIASNLPVLFL